MIQISAVLLNNPTFMGAIRKLAVTNQLPAESAYRFSRISKRIDKEVKDLSVKAMVIHKEYCVLDPLGNPSGLKQGKLEFKEPKEENEKTHDKKFEEMLDYQIEEKVKKIPLKDLASCQLSPVELDLLSPLLELPEA